MRSLRRGAHSAAYLGCPKYKEAKQIQVYKFTERVSYRNALKAVKKQQLQKVQAKEATKAPEHPKIPEPPKTSTDPSKQKGQEQKGSKKSRIPTRPNSKANVSTEGQVLSKKAPSPPKPKPPTKTSECQTDTPTPILPSFNPDHFLALIAYIINGLEVNKSKSDRIKLVVLAAEKCCGIKIAPNKLFEALAAKTSTKKP